MKDIFISHSSRDKKQVEMIKNELEKHGFSCWVSFDINDLNSGKDYMSEIAEAIAGCKVFICCISNNVYKSQQVPKEINVANAYLEYGIKMFGIIVDEAINTIDIKSFPSKYQYAFGDSQLSRWYVEEERNDVLKQIYESVKKSSIKETAEIISNCPENINLVGRVDELAVIQDILEKNRKIYLHGIGGIGKTAIAIAYAHRYGFEKRTVFLPVEESLMRTISNDNILKLNNSSLTKKKSELSALAYANYKLSLLENSINDDTLIIVDNVNAVNDPMLFRILNFNCNIIVTTRNKNFISSWEGYQVKAIKKFDSCVDLFQRNYGGEISDLDKEVLRDLFVSIANHTMSIILLGKQMKYLGTAPEEYKSINQLKSANMKYIHYLFLQDNADDEITGMYRKLQELFNARGLSEEEKRVIKTLMLIPITGIKRELFIKLTGEENRIPLNRLERTGWIESDKQLSLIYLHPVIKDVLMEEFELSMQDEDIKKYIKEFVASIKNCYNSSFEFNLKYKELALSIIQHFPNPTKSSYKYYITISKLLWVLNMNDVSINIHDRVQQLFIDDKGVHSNSVEEAEAAMEIGFVHHASGYYKKASDELENAARIFGNKYAAALSHKAQAMAFDNEYEFEKIEPLLEESLSIREKYWKGTISEAAACHLYAKVLSKYGINLEKAMELEKRAYKIFERLQPDSANVSSSAYILGWLYVQMGEDKDDFEYGIELLEEAKTIRLKIRGGDELNPWMEDMYLKLGMAYEKIENYNFAKIYFELLHDLQKIKYRNDMTNMHVLNTIKLLKEIYEKLGDDEKVNEFKKILRRFG